jgi:hypothetical protein
MTATPEQRHGADEEHCRDDQRLDDGERRRCTRASGRVLERA